MELREALSQISEIRYQMARAAVYRGYRALPVAFSGVLALAAAVSQTALVPSPREQVASYLLLWFTVAGFSALAAGLGMVDRRRRSASVWDKEMTRQAIEQFLPCLVAGALLTIVVVKAAPRAIDLLPGLWQVLFGLGLFASSRNLPRPIVFVAVFYEATGLACIALAQGGTGLSPWAMGLPFGLGQIAAAGILYWTLEREGSDEPR